jgi:hypothetical protein
VAIPIAAASVFGAAAVPAMEIAQQIACVACILLPPTQYAQELFYPAVTNVQGIIVDIIPPLAGLYANACAQGCGADPLLSVAPEYTGGLLSLLGLGNDLSGLTGGFGGVLSSLGSEIPIYAAPLDPRSLSLYVTNVDNGGNLPWDFPSAVGEAGDKAGRIGCVDTVANYPAVYDTTASLPGWNGDWGWDDDYYLGNPGFMTWIAGKAQRGELAGLTNLVWLNAQQSSSSPSDQSIYTNSIFAQGGSLVIPAYIAIASSQCEGTPVISHGAVDAQGRIIEVYLSSNSPGTNYWIYH